MIGYNIIATCCIMYNTICGVFTSYSLASRRLLQAIKLEKEAFNITLQIHVS